MREVNILSLSQETQASWAPNGRFTMKTFVSLCLFLAHIGVSLCDPSPDPPPNPPKSTEFSLSWRTGDFHAEKGK